ncbi:MAG: LCP family protein [Candidatus Rifleibacteriota bacterium]
MNILFNKTNMSKGQLVIELIFIVATIFLFLGIANNWLLRKAVPPGVSITRYTGEDGKQRRIGNVNILVLGVDSVEGTHRSDTIFVLGVNSAKSRISMLSIPRDTRVLINGKARKINEILPRYGQEVLISLIEDLMQIKINRHVMVDYQGFINIIDLIGGVELNIEKPMHYDDNWGNLHIHFEPGINKLDGRDALNYVRYREEIQADLGRIKRQQKFIKTVVKKFSQPSVFIKLPTIVNEIFAHIETDFSLRELVSIASSFSSFNIKFENTSLPGEPRYIDKISYFLPYRDKSIEIGNSHFADLAAFELVASFSSELASGTSNEN